MWKIGDIMKNSKGDIEFEIIDDGLSNATWNVSATGTDEEAESGDKQKKMVITGSSTNTAVDEENVKDSVITGEFKVGSDEIDEFLSEKDRGKKIKKLADGIKEAEKLEKISNRLNEYCRENGVARDIINGAINIYTGRDIAEKKTKQKNAADTFLEDKERLKCIKEQVGDVIKAEEDCKQNGMPFIDAYKEARKQSVKKRIEELAETDGLRTENCSCGSNNKAEKTMAKMAIIYDFIDSLRDDLTIAEVKRRFFK